MQRRSRFHDRSAALTNVQQIYCAHPSHPYPSPTQSTTCTLEGTGYILQIYYSLLLVPSRESEGGYGIYTTDLFTFWTLIEGRAHIVHKFIAATRSVRHAQTTLAPIANDVICWLAQQLREVLQSTTDRNKISARHYQRRERGREREILREKDTEREILRERERERY